MMLRRTPGPALAAHGGAAALLGVPLGELAGRVVSLDHLWGRRAASLREQLQGLPTAALRLDALERFLLQVLLRPRSSLVATPELRWALQRFDLQPAVAQVEPVRASVGWSAQRFIAQFRHEVGLAPKQYCRLRRASMRSSSAWPPGAMPAGPRWRSTAATAIRLT